MSLAVAPPPTLPIPMLLDIARGLASAQNIAPAPADPPSTARTSARLLVTDSYEAWILTWPPGSAIEPHDHGDAHGAFVVVSGALTETRWRRSRARRRTLGPGDASTVAIGAVHGVTAAGRGERAVSVHVYSPPLSEMRFYAADGRSLVGVEAVDESA